MMPDPTPTLNQSLFTLTSLSPRAADSIDLELYRQDADSDESTDDVILQNAILNALRDLETIGLDFGLDYSTLQQTEYLKPFIELLGYILPNGLYPKIKSDDRVRNVIHHLLDGSLGHNETIIQCYLSELGGLDGQSPLVEAFDEQLDRFYPFVTQTETFTDYLRNLYELAAEERMAPETDVDQHQAYRATIRAMITRMSEALALFESNTHYPQTAFLFDALINDLVAPRNFTEYQYIFTTGRDALPDELQPLFEKRWQWYEVSHRWCRAYYDLRHLTPTPPFILLCFCFAYARYTSKEDFLTEYRRMAEWDKPHHFGKTLTALYKA